MEVDNHLFVKENGLPRAIVHFHVIFSESIFYGTVFDIGPGRPSNKRCQESGKAQSPKLKIDTLRKALSACAN